jgi:hypothetical protein
VSVAENALTAASCSTKPVIKYFIDYPPGLVPWRSFNEKCMSPCHGQNLLVIYNLFLLKETKTVGQVEDA